MEELVNCYKPNNGTINLKLTLIILMLVGYFNWFVELSSLDSPAASDLFYVRIGGNIGSDRRYFGAEEAKDDEDSNKNLNKLITKIKKRSKLKQSIEPVTKSPKNDSISVGNSDGLLDQNESRFKGKKKNNTSASPELSNETDLRVGNECEPKEKKRKKKRLSEAKLYNEEDSLVDNENCLISSIEDKLDRLNVNEVNESNSRIEPCNEEENDAPLAGDTPLSQAFPVIGDYKFKKKTKVKRVLPDWLAKPSVVSVDLKNLKTSIHDIPDLQPIFVNTLERNGISHFFPVQAQVIPQLLSWSRQSSLFWPCDVCVSAPTGSGKTLAYVIPILQALLGRRTGQVQALVVLPVQELAAQVAAVFRVYGAGTGLRVHLSTGGLPLHDDRTHLLRQRLGVGWESLCDVLVITPGRLVEHLYSTPGFSLKQLQYIVIDEADRVVDNMQNNWLHHLDQHLSVQGSPLLTLNNLKTMPRRPQKLLFSATLSTDPEKLNQLNLFQPRLFTSVVEATKDKGSEGEFIGKFTTPAELQERMVRCLLAVKPLVLYQLISREAWSRVMVFTASSRSVHQLCALLTLLGTKAQRPLRVAEISAECSHKKRETVLADFAAGKVDVLVSTDALARGIDIPNVQYVISYDMPKYVKAYIHRVGRTGRAGQEGLAVTLVQHSQVGLFQQMLQTAGKQESVSDIEMSEEELKALENPFKEALKELKSVTEGEEQKQLQKTKSLKRVSSVRLLAKKRKKKSDVKNHIKKVKRKMD